MTQSGWRKPTPGLCQANRLAEDGEQLAVIKNQAMLAIRRVAHVIGLKAGHLMLLDTLAAFTKPCDWEKGARPIVWPSNDYLTASTGYSLSALKRQLRRLAEVGLITYRDSSNGKRWGHRDKEGRIVEAFGFDLSPLAARTADFEALHAEMQAERKRAKELLHEVTVLRRTIGAIVDSTLASNDVELWHGIRLRYNALMTELRSVARDTSALARIHQSFLALREEAETAMGSDLAHADLAAEPPCASDRSAKMNPTGSDSAPHIQITIQSQSVICKGIEKVMEEVAPAGGKSEGWRGGDEMYTRGSMADERPLTMDGTLSVRSILYGCPAFAEMAHGIGGHIDTWRDLVVIAERIRPIIGISQDAWASAQSVMSREVAAAALALVTDKYSDGVVSSPGGYLRGLTEKATVGELHLARSIYGRSLERQRIRNCADRGAST